MAYLLPNNLASHSSLRASVQEVAALLRDHTPERVTVIGDVDDTEAPLWVVHPDHGVGLLHVLDGRKKSLQGRGMSLLTGKSEVDELLEQAQALGDDVVARLLSSPHVDRALPVRTLLVVPGMTNAQLERESVSPEEALGSDDLSPSGIGSALARTLGDGERLTAREEKVVRAAITPEIIIRDRSAEDDDPSRIAFRAPEAEPGDDPLAVLDREQQQLAMHLGDGYRVIRGVAGSGKSIVLSHRARYLAQQEPDKRVLLATYNKVIASALAVALDDLENVDVRTIDSFAWSIVGTAHIKLPSGDEKWDLARVRSAKFLAADSGEGHRYDAVLIDEAQDFEHSMLELAYSALDGEDLVIALDGAQNIRRTTGGWSPGGRSAQGRTTVLRRNYRNTREILEFAHGLLSRGGQVGAGAPVEGDVHAIVEPESAARTGPAPRAVSVSSENSEIDAVLDQLVDWHGKGVPWSDMLVLVGNKYRYLKRLYFRARDRKIPYFDVTHGKNRDRAVEAGNVVRASTIQSIKGVEFGHVAVMGVNDLRTGLPDAADDLGSHRRLLYVGLTRATDELFVTVSGTGEIGADVLDLAS